MIAGIGNDICDIRRIEKTIEKYKDKFINRIFTTEEIAKADKRKADKNKYLASYAKMFAAKEAFMKAVGTGYADGVYFKNISVVNDKVGKPIIKLLGVTAEYVCKKVGSNIVVHITITDEYPYAFAVVVLEKM